MPDTILEEGPPKNHFSKVIEISSNGQNCSILSQNVPKFELYKHNDELFNMYYRTRIISANLVEISPVVSEEDFFLISSPFFLICIIGQNRQKFKSSPLKPLNQIKPNLAGMVAGWVPFKIVSDSPTLHSRWPLLLKIEMSSNGQKEPTQRPSLPGLV
jgi:hypothetical protein